MVANARNLQSALQTCTDNNLYLHNPVDRGQHLDSTSGLLLVLTSTPGTE